MDQMMFEEVEFYGKELFVCNTCTKCKRECKVKSIFKSIDVICKRYKKK